MPTYVDAEALICAWLNSRTDLVGPGMPIDLGAFRKPIRSPNSGAYVLLLRVGGAGDLGAETPLDRARISATVYAGTLEAASRAAVAYANVLAAMSGAPVLMGPTEDGDTATCRVVDNITGPTRLDDHNTSGEQWRQMVDADFLLQP